MTHHPFAVANYFIRKAQEEDAYLTPMKLQKLMYFAEGWNAAFKQDNLFSDEIEAWQYGPVVGSVYREFKDFGNSNISRYATTINVSHGRLEVISPEIPSDDTYSRQLLDQIWRMYKPYSAIQLSAMTHEQGTPWHDVYVLKGKEMTRDLTISKQRMRDYFSAQLKRNEATTQNV